MIAANVLFNNHPNDESLAWLYEQNADLVGIVECSTPWVSALARSTHRWPHSIAYPEDGTAGGVALFSRFPLVEERSPGAPVGRFHFIEAVASTERGPVRIFVIHPFPPVTPRATTIRDDEIRWFAERCQQRDMPTVVIGDLNETPFGRAYREFVKATGYRSAREIAPFTPTWPAQTHGYPVPATIRIAIDHCFVSPHFMPTNFIVGRDLGSDHMPIVADLRWAR